MARKAVNPNVDSPPSPHTRKADWENLTDAAQRDAARGETAATDAALSDTLTSREAAARQEVPRARTDAANPNKSRALPPPNAVRGMLSSNMKKDNNKSKRRWLENLPQTRLQAVSRTMTDRENLEGVNRALHSVVGRRSELTPAIRKRVEGVDRAIGDYERTNERQHLVYAVLKAPYPRASSRTALRNRLAEMAGRGDTKAVGDSTRDLTFDGYVPATHSLGTIPDGPDVVMEIRTRSGAYLGTSDTTPNADHIIGRGRVLRPVGVHEVPYIAEDGTRKTRYIVQMDDVTPEN